jgi:hypothetical protein
LVPLGRTKTSEMIINRSMVLWLAGYLLNFFRIYLPARLGLFDPAMLHFYHAGRGEHPFLPLLLTGDILQFAGLAYGITQLLHKGKCNPVLLLTLYLVFAFAAPLVWGLRAANPLVDHLSALLFANDHRAFFPLFPWLCYPLAGLMLGLYYGAHPHKNVLQLLVGPGLVLMLAGIGLIALLPKGWDGDFYRSSPGKTVAFTGFVLVWLTGIHRLVQWMHPQNFLLRLFAFCGQHITVIYCFHWLLVGWGLPLFGYHCLSGMESILTALLVTLLSIGMPLIYDGVHARNTRPKAASLHIKQSYDNTSRV